MSKGQFPLAIAGLIVIVMILKMPGDQVSQLMFTIIEKLERGHLLGYALFVATVVGWFFHARHQRRIIDAEVTRLSNERTRLQRAHLGARVESSEG